MNTLTDEERKMLKQDNYGFIGETKRNYENWINNYNKKKTDYQNRTQQSMSELKNNLSKLGLDAVTKAADIIEMVNTGAGILNIMENPYGDYEKYGIKDPCPHDFDDEDYLSCWKQCWNESKNQKLISKRSSLKQRKCIYFYDYRNMMNKTIELCDEERKEKIEKNRFLWSIVLTGLTFLITFVALLVTFYVK